MKITLKNPISISRLKKKTGYQMAKGQKQNFPTEMNEYKLDDLSTQNLSKELTASKEMTVLEERRYFKNRSIQVPNAKIQLIDDHKKHFILHIQSLEEQNKRLTEQNSALKEKVTFEEKQKQILEARISKFGDDLCKLQAQYEDQLGCKERSHENSERKVVKIGSSKVMYLKQKSIDSKNESDKSHFQGRRMSLQDSVCDLSTKVKQYKNQLQSQKIKRLNLERGLQVYKQNIRIEAKLEIQSLEKKISTMKETLILKNQQIFEKQTLIQRLIRH